MIETNTAEVNFLGKILRKPSINVTSEVFYLSLNGVENVHYPLKSMRIFATIDESIFGNVLRFRSNNEDLKVGFLQKKAAMSFLTTMNQFLSAHIQEYLQQCFSEFNRLVISNYPRDSWAEQIVNMLSELYTCFMTQQKIWKKYLPVSVIEKIELMLMLFPFDMKALQAYHENYQLKTREAFFNVVETNPLTIEQRLGVLRSNDRNMVLAAAGTGKTSVIVAKLLDLIDRRLATPDEILVLAYNRAAVNELKERLESKAVNGNISFVTKPNILTFHALGRQILREAQMSNQISVFAEDDYKLKQWVTKWVYEYISTDPARIFDFIELSTLPIDTIQFKTKSEYEKYIRDNEFRTLKGEKVKGYQELILANYLYVNKIDYEYEPQYLVKRRLDSGFDYRPDFHIKDTDIYIEHYGIDRNGNTRPDINKEKYNEIRKKKQALHDEYKTTLIETFHYEWQEKNLLQKLKDKLTAVGIEFNPMSPNEIFEEINHQQELGSWSDMMKKALQAIRVERLDKQGILERLTAAEIYNADKYSDILNQLHDGYVTELKLQNAIDFDDMIIRSAEIVQTGKFTPQWKYILLDEFQDISTARMELIINILAKGPSPSLTVVGDDWQSIYRFSGGKLELTTRFDELVGTCTLTKLQKTFRYNNSIANFAGTFIMQNPEQYKKEIDTHHKVENSQVYLLDDKIGCQKGLYERTLEVIMKIRQHEPSSSIMIIARYNYLLKEASNIIWNAEFKENISFLSFHKSKGLEADYCILIGFSQGKNGFPNENRGDAVIDALLPSLDNYPYSEERRLLYVGITRAKKKCYIIADPTAPSDFISELLTPKYDLQIVSETFKEQYRKIFKCPYCESGYLRLVKGKFGDFYSCSTGLGCSVRKARVCEKCSSPSVDMRSYSQCNNSGCDNKMKICEKCGRPMKLRQSKYGKFWGCSGYGLKDDRCTHISN
ncbi:helicase IV [Morganella sp. EGD-HP17]|nr:helicase IV [Morganella sp. EGD-HP17]